MNEIEKKTNDTNNLTLYRLDMIEKVLASISDSIKQMAHLEQKHIETRNEIARAFNRIELHDKQIRDIEIELPTIKMTRNWIITGVFGVFGIFGLQLSKVIF